ncbi:MAG: hypothetical protein M1828_007372 [Chrysothrix sp. TS-e1954]|nr:MAG: hypothetical protein M1828_007372 [Chrysothrix sp. TS-e1954]
MESPPLASLSLTQVHYNPADPLSHLSAYLALLPHALFTVYLTLLWSTREFEILTMFAGQMACEGVNWGLKRYFKQARPEGIRHLGKGYGMPSSHAQFVWFFAGSVCLFLGMRHRPRISRDMDRETVALGKDGTVLANTTARQSPSYDRDVDDDAPQISLAYTLQLQNLRLTHTLLSLSTICLATAVSVSRVYLNYHTPAQVLVGCVAGLLFAGLWFAATEFARGIGLVEWMLEWRLSRSARIRDLICEEDLVEMGWSIWEEKRRRRRRRTREETKKNK